jgi:hypothetical protein
MARQIVDPPVFTTLPHGLWDVAQQPSVPGTHWQNGITWTERCPVGATTFAQCMAVSGTGEAPVPPEKTGNVEQTNRGATPFTVYARFDCSPVGLPDASTVAQSALARVEQHQLETAFWTGVAGGQPVVYPRLAADAEVLDDQGVVLQPAASPVVTGAGDPATALGALEQGLADCYRGQGVIHVPRRVLPTLAAWKLVKRREEDGRLVTVGGNLVVAGSGYTGSGPDGSPAAADSSWIYATGAVFGYRSDVYVSTVRDSLDRSTNTLSMLAERTYVIGFECCLLAAHIALGVPTE